MTETYRVGGMHCSGCIAAVTRAIKQIDPGAQISVDIENGNVRVDGALPRDAVCRAVEDAGYSVEG